MTGSAYPVGESAAGHQNIVVESGFGYGVIGADLHVFQDRGPVYLLTVHGDHPVVTPGQLRGQPSRLLTAGYRIVTFTGRDEEQRALTAWRDDSRPGLAVKWLYGPGGQGKTRLADEFAEQSAAAGWKVVHAHHTAGSVHPPLDSQDLRLRHNRGLLVLIDYADRWPHSHLAWFFSNALLHQDVPTRVLLLARSLQPWAAVRAALESPQVLLRGARADVHTSELPLPALSTKTELAERQRMFAVARDCFAFHYGIAPDKRHAIVSPQTLGERDFGLILALHMAALVAVDTHSERERARESGNERGNDTPPPPQGLANLSAYLLRRERLHWTGLWANHLEGLDFRTPPSLMARTVFGAALTGPVARAEGKAIVRALDLEGHPDRILDDHAVCYPPAAAAKTVLEPLYPDRLCEDFLALMLPGHHVTDFASDTWADDAVHCLLGRRSDGSPPAHLPRALTFLSSAAAPDRWPHVAHCLTDTLVADPQLAVDAGGAALSGVAEACEAPVLSAVESVMPERRTDLDIAMAAIVHRLTDLRIAENPDPLTKAHLLAMRGYRKLNAGDYAAGVAAYRECATIRRDLALTDSAVMPDLARALNNLGNGLADLGRHEEALSAYEEAVEIRRPLVPSDPGENWLLLATELMNLGNMRSKLGLHQQGYDAVREAVGIRRTLADFNSELFGDDLAVPLTSLGEALLQNGRPEEALQAHLEAVAIHRERATADPGRCEPDLSTALVNLGVLQLELGLNEEARRTTAESIGIQRRLVDANPAVFEAGLAGALGNLRLVLVDLGLMREAHEASEEAAEIYRRLADGAPEIFEPLLAGALINLAFHLHHAGQPQYFLRVSEEAMALYEKIRARSKSFPASEYATGLLNLSTALSEAGEQHRAVELAAEAVRVRRELAQDFPGAETEAELADALRGYGTQLGRIGRGGQALGAYEEAVTIYHRATGPQAQTPNHEAGRAALLRTYGLRLSIEGRQREAYAVTSDAVSGYRRIEQTRPGLVTSELALSLRQLSALLLWPMDGSLTSVPQSTRARIRQGLEASAEAVEIQRGLAEAHPGRFEPDLAMELMAFARLRMAGRVKRKRVEALRASSEAIEILRRLARTDPSAYQDQLTEAVATHETWSNG
ncbi:tetratricopeptide repeat protein [Streptomyces sp. NPDC101776]|uniref:tetratricopeptide repeat protein n=1 Tax=Streptomyces sp. NPDC101776 TaxID=3366146 RepID=UPI00382357E6